MREAGLAFGSNLGDKLANIRAAIYGLGAHEAVTITAVSSAYRTPPWGYEDQSPFLNACAVAQTSLEPHALLAFATELERDIGRTSTFRWGPRVIDIDIVYMDGVGLSEERLTIPHKEALNRAFVLVPLLELRPDLVLNGVAIADAMKLLDTAGIDRVDVPILPADGGQGAAGGAFES